jgi:hypothetical protein
MMTALGEEHISLKDQKAKSFFKRDEFVSNVFETFVKQKEAIIVYVNELVRFAAKTNGVDVNEFTVEFEESKS